MGIKWFQQSDSDFEVLNYGSSVVADEDSMQLIIGIDYAKSWAYNNIANAVTNSKGKIVNTVPMGDRIVAVVADIPLTTLSSFKEQMNRNSLVRYVEPNMKR